MQERFTQLLLAVLAGICISMHAAEAADSAAAAQAGPSKNCKTALDLIATQNTNLPLHPVFQNILNSEDLEGTMFIPTTEAWDAFFATMRQRQGNPAAPAMVARYGQILLYHLAKDVAVPVAQATPGVNKFAVDTASTLQCTFGPGLPNNRLVIKKTPQAIYVEHGTGNATIVSQKMSYCGGEAYLVDQVLNPCSDVGAIMAEVANIPSPCKSNVEGALNRNELTYFNALLLATGVQRPIFNSVRNFTLFAPSDTAIQNAFRSGALNYPYLYAKNFTTLEGIVAFHAVPQYQFAAPSKQTLNMKTLLTEGTGKAKCASPSLSWRSDGFVYGGSGSAQASDSADRGCNTAIHAISEVLQPCCKPMKDVLGGPSGLAATAPADSIQAKAYQYLLAKVKGGAAGASFIMPSAEAWAQFEKDTKKQKVKLTDDKLDALFSYLLTSAPITSQTVNNAAPVPMSLAGNTKAISALCPKGSNATIVFTTDESSQLPASSDTAAAARPAVAATSVLPGAAAAPALPGAAAAPVPAFPSATAPGAATAYPGTAAPTLGAADTFQPAPAAPVLAAASGPFPSAITNTASTTPEAPGLGRKLQQGAAAGDALASSNLLLPTTFVDKPTMTGSGATTSAAAVAGPIVLVDGQEMELEAGVAIPVISMTYACDGVIYNTDAVPLPCNLLKRTKVVPPPVAPLASNVTEVLPAKASADAVNATAANTTTATSAAGAVAPLMGSLGAALLLAVVLV